MEKLTALIVASLPVCPAIINDFIRWLGDFFW